jgi:hypothetical protein
MTKKELIELLKDYPDDAVIYSYADHGQTPEQVNRIYASKDEEDLRYYGDEMDWKTNVKKKEAVTAICIG